MWIPELRGIQNGGVHTPWTQSKNVLERAGVELGRTYPYPIVQAPEWSRHQGRAVSSKRWSIIYSYYNYLYARKFNDVSALLQLLCAGAKILRVIRTVTFSGKFDTIDKFSDSFPFQKCLLLYASQ